MYVLRPFTLSERRLHAACGSEERPMRLEEDAQQCVM